MRSAPEWHISENTTTPEKISPLSETQQAILDRVLAILREDPELNQKVRDAFRQNLEELASDAERLDMILEKLQDTKAKELEFIQQSFMEGTLDAETAKRQSKGVILRYTELQLGMVRVNAEFLQDSQEADMGDAK